MTADRPAARSGHDRSPRRSAAAGVLPGARATPRRPAPAVPAPAPPPRAPGALGVLPERVRRAWDRPLTAYYLIIGGSLLILVLGLVMVFSASQIKALQNGLPSTYFFRKQLLAAAIGAVLLVVAARLPVRSHRALAYPLLAGSLVLMTLVQIPGIGKVVNGNRNWLSVGGPFQIQPSEFGKLALVLWGADLLARKYDKR